MAASPAFFPHPTHGVAAGGPAITPSRRLRHSPYHARVMAAGPRSMTVYNHMLLPTAFDDQEDAYWHLVEHVQVWDVSAQRQVEIAGPDALRLVEAMTPRPLASCAVGQCRYAPLVDERGGLVNDPVVLRLAEDRFWLSLADSDVLLWAKGLAYGMGLHVALGEPDVSPLAVQGPKADAVVRDLLGDAVAALGFFRFREVDLDGIPLVVARSGWSKQGGFELYLRDAARGVDLWDRVMEAGQPYDVRPGTPGGTERIESGLLSYGSDMTLDDSPRQCGLESYCKLDKRAGYLAREALVRESRAAPDRRLARIALGGPATDGDALPWTVSVDGEHAGVVTSTTWSPRQRRNIGFAMLATAAHVHDAPLRVEMPRGEVREAVFVGDINAEGWG